MLLIRELFDFDVLRNGAEIVGEYGFTSALWASFFIIIIIFFLVLAAEQGCFHNKSSKHH
jgi:hypothetical protein